jgi:hypothetical protein
MAYNFLEGAVGAINESLLRHVFTDWINPALYGISRPVVVVKDGGETALPAFQPCSANEPIMLIMDDRNSVYAYHKLTGVNTARARQGYGDGEGMRSYIAQMGLLVWVNRPGCELTQEEIMIKVDAAFPTRHVQIFDTVNKSSFSINLTSVILNEPQIVRNEYGSAIQFFLTSEQLLLQFNYTIEGAVNLKCLNKC